MFKNALSIRICIRVAQSFLFQYTFSRLLLQFVVGKKITIIILFIINDLKKYIKYYSYIINII